MSTASPIMRVLGLLSPYRRLFGEALICVLLSNGFSLAVPILLSEVVDAGVRPGHTELLIISAVEILIASSLRGAFAYGQGYLGQSLSQRVAFDLRQRLHGHIQQLSFSFHDQAETGQLMSRATVDVEALRMFISLGLLRAISGLVLFVGVAIWLVRLSLPHIAHTDWATHHHRAICPGWSPVATDLDGRAKPHGGLEHGVAGEFIRRACDQGLRTGGRGDRAL